MSGELSDSKIVSVCAEREREGKEKRENDGSPL